MKIFVDEYSNYELKTLLRRIYRNDISIINNYNKLHYLGKSAYAILSQSNYNIHGNYLIIYSTVEYTNTFRARPTSTPCRLSAGQPEGSNIFGNIFSIRDLSACMEYLYHLGYF